MLFIIVLIWVVCIVAGYNMGSQRTIGATAGLLLGLFLGIIGLIIVAVSPPKTAANALEPQKAINNEGDSKSAVADQIMKWHELKEKGAITAEEFEEKKRQLLS